jgi:hypothetical protein
MIESVGGKLRDVFEVRRVKFHAADEVAIGQRFLEVLFDVLI